MNTSKFQKYFAGSLMLAIWIFYLAINTVVATNQIPVANQKTSSGLSYVVTSDKASNAFNSIDLSSTDTALFEEEVEDDSLDTDFITTLFISFVNQVVPDIKVSTYLSRSLQKTKTVSLVILYHSWKSFLS